MIDRWQDSEQTSERLSRAVRWQFLAAMLLIAWLAPSGTAHSQPPATEKQPPKAQEDPKDSDDPLEEGMQRFWNRFGGRSRGASIYQRSHDSIKESFVSVSRKASQSTVRVLVNGAQAALGTIVDPSGLILTKASELRAGKQISCQLYDNRTLPAVQVGENDEYDFALLKVEAKGLKVAPWTNTDLAVGAWLVTPGVKDVPLSIGVVSVSPRRIAKSRALIGVRLGPNPNNPAGGAVVGMVFPRGGADRAGVKVNDVIIRADDREITTPEDLIAHVSGLLPGDRVKLMVRRGEEEKSLTAELLEEQAFSQSRVETQNSLGGPISRRRSGFPRVLQHDSVLRPEECGGPLVNLQGQVVGLNIARAGRVASYAIPTQEVLQVIPTMIEKIDKFQDVLASQKVAELQRNIGKIESVLKAFEDRLAEAVKEAQGIDPKMTEVVKMKKKRVDLLEIRIAESKARLAEMNKDLEKLREQPVKAGSGQ